MKVLTKYLWMETKKDKEIVSIHSQIESIAKESGIKEGFALVSAMHITSSVFVNDYEQGLWEDLMKWLEEIAPSKPDYKHHLTGETNADAHLKRSVLGHQVLVPITSGKLDLGPWEHIFYGEFDGRRKKRVIVKVFGE
ncbi:YjbQ family protein [Candidatus Parvarchaeota archaeon]|nr:YjbQ family protein [Candidatus Parvarchaeota archaeon]